MITSHVCENFLSLTVQNALSIDLFNARTNGVRISIVPACCFHNFEALKLIWNQKGANYLEK